MLTRASSRISAPTCSRAEWPPVRIDTHWHPPRAGDKGRRVDDPGGSGTQLARELRTAAVPVPGPAPGWSSHGSAGSGWVRFAPASCASRNAMRPSANENGRSRGDRAVPAHRGSGSGRTAAMASPRSILLAMDSQPELRERLCECLSRTSTRHWNGHLTAHSHIVADDTVGDLFIDCIHTDDTLSSLLQ